MQPKIFTKSLLISIASLLSVSAHAQIAEVVYETSDDQRQALTQQQVDELKEPDLLNSSFIDFLSDGNIHAFVST